MNATEAGCLNDGSFGPIVVGCRDDFDFTRTFEQSMFSIAPSVAMILVTCARLSYLHGQPVVIHVGKSLHFLLAKLAAVGVFVGLQTALVALAAYPPREDTHVAAAVLGLCASLLVFAASPYEHARSLRPSTLLCTYLFFTILFDIAQTRTQWLSLPAAPSTKVFTASLAVKSLVLVLESQHKTRWVAQKEQEDDKNRNPEITSGIFYQSFYFWLNGLLLRGYRSHLGLDDLFGLDRMLGAAANLNRNRPSSEPRRAKPTLLTTMLWTLKWPFLAPVIPRLALGGFMFSQPFFINAILNHLQEDTPDSSSSARVRYGLIGASAIIYTGIAVSTGLYWRAHQRALCRLRAYLVVAVYGKLVSQRASDDKNSTAMTLMNSDIMGVQGGFRDVHELWASVIESAVASWLLYRQLGPAFLAPIIIVLICTGLTLGVGKFTGPRFRAAMQFLQKRVALSAAVTPNLVAIKASAMDSGLATLIHGYRVKQIESMRRFRILTTVSTILAFAPILLSPVVTFSISMGDNRTLASVFTSLAWIHLLCHPMTQLLQSVPQILAALASVRRIQDFLDSESRVDNRLPMGADNNAGKAEAHAIAQVQPHKDTVAHLDVVRVEDCNVGWKSGTWALKNLNLGLPKASFTLLLGPVASGKSTLCKALLGEVPFLTGAIHIRRQPEAVLRIAYCDQDPFLINSSIRENIMGSDHDVATAFNGPWYEEVVRACHLAQDFALLPHGDQTQVGSKGSALSGGQRRRVALARAIYARPELAVLDDPLGGIDSRTESLVARDVFGPDGVLRRLNTTVLLTAQRARHLSFMDQVVVLRDKGVVFQGSSRDMEPQLQPDSSSPRDADVSDLISPVSEADLDDDATSQTPEEYTFKFTPQPKPTPEENKKTATQFPEGGIANYRYYFSFIGIPLLVLYLVLVLCFSFLFSFSTVWLQFWAADNQDPPDHRAHTTGFYLGIYFGLQIVCLAALALDVWLLGNVMGPKAGLLLHLRTLQTLIQAPLRFYSTVDSSVPTGYLSQDMGIVDNQLNGSFGNTVRTGLTVVGQAAVIATASPYLLVGYPVLLGVLFCVQKVYLRTSTQLRHLVLESKNPLYKHFIETVDGLITIRAFNQVPSHVQQNSHLLDESQRPSYLLAMLQQWLNLVLNMAVACIALVVVALATQLRTSAGFTGVALVSLMSFGEMVGNLVRCYTELQTAAAALSRLRGFEQSVPGEDDGFISGDHGVVVPEDWPKEGRIDLQSVSVSYETTISDSGSSGSDSGERTTLRGRENELDENNSKSPPPSPVGKALREVTLSIAPGERVLVCGRTGSGKSTLLLLFQGFLAPSSGNGQGGIRIDNVPLPDIPRSTLRRRIIALPQTPFFLPDGHTIRDNLKVQFDDGDNDTNDDEVMEYALQAVGLWDDLVAVSQQQDSSSNTPLGLASPLREEALSRGQRQMFGLARAVMRARARARLPHRKEDEMGGRSGILLLDEYNAGLDADTDKAMWAVISREFRGYTIVCVAHRLRYVAECYDKVVVMADGRIVEAGSPGELLARKDGKLRELWELEPTGSEMAG